MVNISKFYTYILQERFLFLSFFGLLAAGFFFLPTPPHRTILYIGTVSVLALLFIRDRADLNDLKANIFKNKLALVSFFFLFYMALSVAWSSPEDAEALIKGIRVCLYICLFFLAYYYAQQKFPEIQTHFIKLFILAAVISAPLIIFNNFVIEGKTFIRLSGFGRAANPVMVGLYYGVALLLVLFPDKNIKQWLRPNLKWLFATLILSAFILSFSRGPILSICLVSIFLLLLDGKIKIILSLMVAICVGAMIIYFGDFIPNNFLERGTSGRLGMWEQALDLIRQKIIFGHGSITKFYYDVTYMGTLYENYSGLAHSVYLSTLIQGGVVGLCILMAIYYLAIKAAYLFYRNENNPSVLIFLLTGALLGVTDFGGFYVNLGPEWLVFWCPIMTLIHYQMVSNASNHKGITLSE